MPSANAARIELFYCVTCAQKGSSEPFFTRKEYDDAHKDGLHFRQKPKETVKVAKKPTQKEARELAIARMKEIAACEDAEEAHRDRDQLMIDLLGLFAPEVVALIEDEEAAWGEDGYGYAYSDSAAAS